MNEEIDAKAEPLGFDHKVIILTKDGKIDLVPGPVYCFYSLSKFTRKEASPSFEVFRKKLMSLDIKGLILHGKPLVDPYYLDWRYRCRLKYEKLIRKFQSRSGLTNEAKEVNQLMKKHLKALAKLQKQADRKNVKALAEKLTAEFQSKPAVLKKKLAALEKHWSAYQREFVRISEEIESQKQIHAHELSALKERWKRRNEILLVRNKPYLENFDEAQKKAFGLFETNDLKRISRALERSLDTRDNWKDFYFQMRNPIIRFFEPWNRTLATAMRHNKRWLRTSANINPLGLHRGYTLNAIKNFKIGLLGQEKMNLVDSKKTIGTNLIKILMITNECGEAEAREEAIALMSDLGLYDPKDILGRYLWEFINDDYHYKIELAYLLAFSPEVLVVDRSALNTGHGLTSELNDLLVKLQPKYGFVFVLFDDSMFGKDFNNMVVYDVDSHLQITPSEKYIKNSGTIDSLAFPGDFK